MSINVPTPFTDISVAYARRWKWLRDLDAELHGLETHMTDAPTPVEYDATMTMTIPVTITRKMRVSHAETLETLQLDARMVAAETAELVLELVHAATMTAKDENNDEHLLYQALTASVDQGIAVDLAINAGGGDVH